ncbi:methyltransferase domain-containing protein [Candidatus Parcubacteria bacterium]|nr:methyltransferase domain-containing protein [Candidatus Parcubacteria bacterium]
MSRENWGITLDEKKRGEQNEINEKGKPERSRSFKKQEFDNQKTEEGNEGDLEIARNDLEKIPAVEGENTEEDSLKEKKISPEQFREEIKRKAEKFDGSKTEEVVNFVRDGVSELKFCRGPREGFAEAVSNIIIEVLMQAGIDNEELAKIENIIDIGGGYGDNLKATIAKIKEMRENDDKINGVCLDSKTGLSKKVESDEEVVGSFQDAKETSFKDNSFDLVVATHLLQEIKGIKNKENILQEMKRISKGRMVLMVEEKRSGVDGLKDWANHVANNFNTKFDVLRGDQYKKLFEELGLTIESEIRSEPNKITYLLKFDRKEDK